MHINELIATKRVLQSNNSGPFIIIRNLGRINKRNKVLIKFINTGSIVECITYNALNGRVSDPNINRCIDYDKSRYIDYDAYIINLLRTIYSHMISRCYNINDPKYKAYGAKGVTVCKRWVDNINNFITDCKNIDGFEKFYNNPKEYQLDKDYKQHFIPKNSRIYSKETCIFLYYKDNTNLKCIDKGLPISGYYGVELNSAGNYYARINVNGVKINIGTFSNGIAAANAFNHMQLKYHNFELVPLLNNVPYMPPEEFIKYNVNIKEICNIV